MDHLKVLATFVQIAKAGSLASAARDLDISPALASSHLKQLEDHLGVRLINRSTRHLALTEVGHEYLRFSKKILNSFAEEEATVSKWHSSPRGHLKIFSSTAFGNFQLTPIVTEFAKRFDQIQVSLMVTETHVSGVDLIDSGYDLAFTSRLMDDASVYCTRIATADWLPWASPGYIRHHGEPLAPEDLANHNCLSHRSIADDGMWSLRRGEEIVRIKVSGSFASNTVVPIAAMLAAGSGIGLLPTYSVMSEVEQGRLVRVLRDYVGPSKPVFAIYPHARRLPQKVRTFLDFARRQLVNNASREPRRGKTVQSQ